MVKNHPAEVIIRYYVLAAVVLAFAIPCFYFSIFYHDDTDSFQGIAALAISVDNGQVRCTSGNLVSSSTECPSSDICPPSERLGTVVHCSLREPHKSSLNIDEITKEKKALDVSIFTNQNNYEKGKIVTITIKNKGTQPFTFSDRTSDIKIRKIGDDRGFELPGVPDKFTLDSGGSMKFKWNQEDDEGTQVKSGKYSIILSLGNIKDRDIFTIRN